MTERIVKLDSKYIKGEFKIEEDETNCIGTWLGNFSDESFPECKTMLDKVCEAGLNMSINILPEQKRDFHLYMTNEEKLEFEKCVEDKVAIYNPLEEKISSSTKKYLGPQGIYFTIHIKE